MRKAYLLVFDRKPSKYKYTDFHKFIKNSSSIITWWHYIKSCYLLISSSSADELSVEIRGAMPDHHFLLTEVNLKNSDGWLDEKAWNWIERYEDL